MSDPTKKAVDSMSLKVMRWPVLWGALATIGFYVAIRAGHIQHALITRYFASHPVEYIATTMFFVGLAALTIKFLELLRQPIVSADEMLGPVPESGQPIEQCPQLLAAIDGQAAAIRNSLLVIRLRDAIDYVRRTRSAAGIEDQMRTLAENCEARSSNGYSLVRIVISTIPILGFLGTVIGITRAVAELAQLVGDISFEDAINSVVSGLSVAFDTTALALGLSIVLMFAMFFISRWETRRLDDIETAASLAIIGRFESAQPDFEPQVAAVRQIGEEVNRSTEGLVERQADLWSRSMETANERWTTMAATAEKQLETALTRALHAAAIKHGEQLVNAEIAAAARAKDDRAPLLASLNHTADAAAKQQQELSKQTELLMKTVDATERVLKLETALNHNLETLRDTQHFDQTVNSLSAAISLLNSKLGHVPSQSPPVRLPRSTKPGNAA